MLFTQKNIKSFIKHKRLIHNASYIQLSLELNEERMMRKRLENEKTVLNTKIYEQENKINQLIQRIKESEYEKKNFETRLSNLQKEYFYKYEMK